MIAVMEHCAYHKPEQIKKVAGYTAPPEFIESVKRLANEHNPLLQVDQIRAYHFGAQYIVELEVVLPADMTLRNSHDVGLSLQHKVELMDEVERAFVHVSVCALPTLSFASSSEHV
jgi:divalent metal cation (Fe/Co/Zn/Cd) transporter